jgi:hypothetical protein
MNNERRKGTTIDSAAFIPATIITKLARISISCKVFEGLFDFSVIII